MAQIKVLNMHYRGTWTVTKDEETGDHVVKYYFYHFGKKRQLTKFHGQNLKSCLSYLIEEMDRIERSTPCITPQS